MDITNDPLTKAQTDNLNAQSELLRAQAEEIRLRNKTNGGAK